MASLSHQFLSLLFLLSLSPTSINGDFTQSPPSLACPSFDCGNGVNIHYPFWHQSQQHEQCGYPGFNLSCNDQNPMIYLSNSDYPIKTINYSSKSFTLTYTQFKEPNNCPRVPLDMAQNITSSSLFNFTSGNKILHFYYNCTLAPPSLPHITCLVYGHKKSYVFKEGAIPEFDWHRYCETVVSVPVIDEVVGNGNLVQGFGQALQDGFELTWMQPHGACQSCEARGGFCGYSTGLRQDFFCICADGRRSSNCYDKGPVSIQPEATHVVAQKQEADYVAIGALVSGGLVIAAMVLYFMQKKNVGQYKPV